jgi:5-methyltetrahydropteroyltriglutamate--homocysteine methyltransferase
MPATPPFRADHIGSLLRPPELIEARHKLREGKITEEDLAAIEDRTIGDVVKLQEDIGLRAVRRRVSPRRFFQSFRQKR